MTELTLSLHLHQSSSSLSVHFVKIIMPHTETLTQRERTNERNVEHRQES